MSPNLQLAYSYQNKHLHNLFSNISVWLTPCCTKICIIFASGIYFSTQIQFHHCLIILKLIIQKYLIKEHLILSCHDRLMMVTEKIRDSFEFCVHIYIRNYSLETFMIIIIIIPTQTVQKVIISV